MRATLTGRLGPPLVAIATGVVVIVLAVLPFLTPAWLSFAQDRADAAAWTGYSASDLRVATDALVRDLVLGPPAFDAIVAGAPVLSERERSHLRDVRTAFAALAALALVSVVVLAVAVARGRGSAGTWRSVRAGAYGLVGGVVVLGAVAVVAFDAAFDLFHRLLFAGNYTFDPRTDRMVQLFPSQLFFETTIALGALIVVLGLLVGRAAGIRASRLATPVSMGERPAESAVAGLGEARP
jgi:integral membrane protein (TIGR01906 family)